MLLLKLLDTVPFFWQFSDDEKRIITENDSFFESFEDGDFIIRENDADTSLLVLIKGEVAVTKEPHPKQVLTTMGPGAMFGEISFLTSQPRTSNVIAQGQAIVFKMDQHSMELLEPQLQNKIKDQLIEVLVKRLVKMNDKLIAIAEILNN